MLTAAQIAGLMPGDIVDVRFVVCADDLRAFNAGDCLRVRTGDARGTATIHVPFAQVSRVVANGNGEPVAYPPIQRAALAALCDEAERAFAKHRPGCLVASLCDAPGLVTEAA